LFIDEQLVLVLFVSFVFSEGLGSFFGTLGGPIKDLDPTKPKYRERSKPASEKSNFKIRPPKQGTGYGYVSFVNIVYR
jgi:hypothetical protein